MLARYIFAVLALLFLAAGIGRFSRGRAGSHAAGRTWILLGTILGIVSAWLFYEG